jgi:hypothetical protein
MTLGVSQEFEWPLRHPHAVEDVIDAVEELEAILLAAGWVPVAPGTAWYAKRFSYDRAHGVPLAVADRQRALPRRRAIRLAQEPKPAS